MIFKVRLNRLLILNLFDASTWPVTQGNGMNGAMKSLGFKLIIIQFVLLFYMLLPVINTWVNTCECKVFQGGISKISNLLENAKKKEKYKLETLQARDNTFCNSNSLKLLEGNAPLERLFFQLLSAVSLLICRN